MSDVLNPVLFARLENYYGEGQVSVVAQGTAMSWDTVWELIPGGGGKKRPKRVIQTGGEEYRVRCKLCNDYKQRLHINHRWGAFDEETNTSNLWMVNCFNEDCYREYESQVQLYQCVFSVNRNRKLRMPILEGREDDGKEIRERSWPGYTWPLEELAKNHPGNQAVRYLESRGFDPEKLGKLWGLRYCADSDYEHARNRIIIPVYYQKMLIGWQARYIGDTVGGLSFKEAGVPKYWTQPGYRKGLMAYNVERALRHKTLVLVEGPADAWNTGPMALALLGKSLSPQMLRVIIRGMARHGTDGVIVVLLDPKQDAKALARKEMHHIDKVCKPLHLPMGGRILPVRLPEEYDPGSIDRDWMREIMHEQASKKNIKLNFSKPTI